MSATIPTGTIVNDRYEVRGLSGRHGLWEMLLAFDRVAGHDVVLEWIRPERELPWTALHPEPSMRPAASQMRFDAAAQGELPAGGDEDKLFAAWAGRGRDTSREPCGS